MDIARQFRRLVIENSISDNTICDQNFAFETVFYMGRSSYCLCRCAYDHEYLTYISDDGSIDTEKFDMISQAVEIGYCEHAIQVESREYLKETKVHSIHIAAALGLEEMVETILATLNSEWLSQRQLYQTLFNRTMGEVDKIKHSKIFHLTPCDIGCLKHNLDILHLVDKLDPQKSILYVKENGNNVLHIEETFLLEICVQKINIANFRSFLDGVEANRTVYYELLYKYSLNDVLEAILEQIKCKTARKQCLRKRKCPYQSDMGMVKDVVSVCELAVIYNQFDVFENAVNTFLDMKFCPANEV